MWPMVVVASLALPGPPTQPAASENEPPPATAPAQPAAGREPVYATGFIFRTVRFDDETYAYTVYVPPEYTPRRAWPVVIFLHGSGERGTDGMLQTEIGLGPAIRRHRDLVPAVVVMPQCRPDDAWWSERMTRMTAACLEQTYVEYRLDPERLYVTGLSLGGAGTWFFAARFPRQVAAIAPICGFLELQQPTGLAEKLAPHLVDVPTWCFHGARDQNVPVERSRELIDAIRRAGGGPRYTEFADGEHGVWDRVYRDPAFWQWLLAQRRALEPELRPPAAPASRPAGP